MLRASGKKNLNMFREDILRNAKENIPTLMRNRYAEDPGEKESNKNEGIEYAEDLREKDFINNEDKIC